MEEHASSERPAPATNRELTRLLDAVDDGLLAVDITGRMSPARSRVLDAWFGAPASSDFFAYIHRISPDASRWLRLGWDALHDDVLPAEVVLDQLPRRLVRGARTFGLDYRPIVEGRDGGRVVEVLVIVRDITERIERERAELGQREAIAVFRRMLQDREGLQSFVAEGSALVDAVEGATDPATAMRAIHTLKGIAALFGVESVTALCHELEERVSDRGDEPTPDERWELRAAWLTVCALVEQLGGTSASDVLEIQATEHEALLRAIEASEPTPALLARVRSWRGERAARRLQRFAEQIRVLARRLGKGDVDLSVVVSPPDLRLPTARWAPFWSAFTHVLRNAVDHGIESAEERAALGKAVRATLRVELTADARGITVRVSDDGRGIDWERLRARAMRLGLEVGTQNALVQALFVDGVTSRDVASETSGRGVGLGAVRAAVHAAGGTVEVTSEPRRGTSWAFRFPPSMVQTTDTAA